MKSKRKELGFDESSDEEPAPREVTRPANRKRIKLPKLTLQLEEADDIDDERPTFHQIIPEDVSDEQEDYLSITIVEDDECKPKSLQEISPVHRGIQKSKAELMQDRLRTSLFGQISESHGSKDILTPLPNTPLASSRNSKSKGLSIMEKMGFTIGDVLGTDNKNKTALLEPIMPVLNSSRAGIRETRTPTGHIQEWHKNDETEFRSRLNQEHKDASLTKVVHRMQKYCYEFSGDADVDIEKLDPLDVNVMWRGYVKYIQGLLKANSARREESVNEKEDHTEADSESKHTQKQEDATPEDEGDDFELSVFEELPISDQVQRLNLHLRSEFDYCFYCGLKYNDQKDLSSNCPGDTEDDHN